MSHTTGIWYSTWYSNKRPYIWSTGNGTGSAARFLADVDGDGLDDAVLYFAGDGSWYVGRSTGSSFGSFSKWTSGHGVGSARQLVADVTGDGKADSVVYFSDGKWYVAPSTGSGFGGYALWIDGHGAGAADVLLGDVTGDGKADAVSFSNSGSWHVAPSTGSSFGGASPWVSGHGFGSKERFLADVTGDGKADAIVNFADGKWYVAPSTGSGFGGYSLWGSFGELASERMVGDVDGDGRADFIAYYGKHADPNIFAGSQWELARSSGSAMMPASLWKNGHGRDYYTTVKYPSPPAAPTWVGLGAVVTAGRKSPVVFHNNDGRWKVMPPGEYTSPTEQNLWEYWGIAFRPLINGQPTAYDSGDHAVIDGHLAQLSAAGVDFLLFDLTNGVGTAFIYERAAEVCKRIAAWNSAPSHKPMRYAIAVGAIQFDNNPATFEQEAAFVRQHFLEDASKGGASTYFRWEGKPLLVLYASYQQRQSWEAWSGDKSASGQFTLRFAQGTVPQNGTPPASEYGMYTGWVYPNGALGSGPIMVAMPGHDNHQGSFVSRNDGGLGKRYTEQGWNRIITAKPALAIVNSWNEFAEQTAVEPAVIQGFGAPAEAWPSPSFYWDATVSSIAAFEN